MPATPMLKPVAPAPLPVRLIGRTVDWAVTHGIETATFHILTPYPGTALHTRMEAQGRILTRDWDRYDTRHAVFTPARMTGETLEAGYWRAYRDFYRWGAIARGARAHDDVVGQLRHAAYAIGWKKCEPLWDLVIRARQTSAMLPALEAILSGFGRRGSTDAGAPTPYSTRAGARGDAGPSMPEPVRDYGSASVV